jgi:mannan endo-1,4-beta-mannosidase
LDWCDKVAAFISQLKDSTGKLIPIIFRPYHEFDGDWFWWGKRHCTREEFIELWKTTVDYFEKKHGLRNILWAFSAG